MLNPFRFFWKILVLAAVLWFVCFVELGDRTLLDHALRIAQTDEAQDLHHGVRKAGKKLGTEIKEKVGSVQPGVSPENR